MKRILVVDDEKEYCDFFNNYLMSRGCIVDIAYDGLSAKDMITAKKYDYIFFDCNMPEMSGVELIKVIKERNPGARKVMISGYDLIDEDFVKNMECDAFLSKPISLEKIKELVKDV